MEVEFRKWITRDQLQAEPHTLFIFGDNLLEKGLGGQAGAMRGEPNAYGVPTKRTPSMDPDAFFSDQPDEMYAVLVKLKNISRVLEGNSMHWQKVVWPMDGIGSGLAKLVDYSPYIWVMIQQYQNWLRKYVNLD